MIGFFEKMFCKCDYAIYNDVILEYQKGVRENITIKVKELKICKKCGNTKVVFYES